MVGWSARAAGGGETVDVSLLFSSFETNSNHFTTIPLPPLPLLPPPPLPSLVTEACASNVPFTDADDGNGTGRVPGGGKKATANLTNGFG